MGGQSHWKDRDLTNSMIEVESKDDIESLDSDRLITNTAI